MGANRHGYRLKGSAAEKKEERVDSFQVKLRMRTVKNITGKVMFALYWLLCRSTEFLYVTKLTSDCGSFLTGKTDKNLQMKLPEHFL